MNAYEQAREDRIKRNNAMLAQLEIQKHADDLAAPLAAAADAEAKKEASIRAQLAAVEPRQRSTRGSAAQAKAALTKQAQAQSVHSDDSQDGRSSGAESDEQLDDDSTEGRGAGRKRKTSAEEEEDDYDPLEDHMRVQNADSSASEADSSAHPSDASDVEEAPQPSTARTKRQQQGRSTKADRQRSGKARASTCAPAMPEQEQLGGSEDDDFELQQVLAMSLLDWQKPSPAQQGPSGLPASMKSEAVQQQPGPLTLHEEDVEEVKIERFDDKKSLAQSSAAATPSRSASKAAPAANDSKGAAAKAGAGDAKRVTSPAAGKQGAQRGRKQPAKGKAIEIHNPADINKAFAMISGGATGITEHHLQRVWSDVRGGTLDKLACNNMLTYAADITGEDSLDRSAFAKLCEHFS